MDDEEIGSWANLVCMLRAALQPTMNRQEGGVEVL